MTDRPKVIATITGGLGNQLFQYAAGLALAQRTNAELVLDLSFYGKARHRAFELGLLGVTAPSLAETRRGLFARLLEPRPPVFCEAGFQYDPRFAGLAAPATLRGYFQSARYFAGQEDSVRAAIRVPEPADAETARIMAWLGGRDFASLHVRRGDYVSVSNATQYDTCGPDYYMRALGRLPQGIPVVVFSDDIGWAKTNLPDREDMTHAGQETPRSGLADLWLMTRASHHIIANSTFSWWGAFLAGRNDGIVLAPSRWFGNPSIDTRDILPERWVRVEN